MHVRIRSPFSFSGRVRCGVRRSGYKTAEALEANTDLGSSSSRARVLEDGEIEAVEVVMNSFGYRSAWRENGERSGWSAVEGNEKIRTI